MKDINKYLIEEKYLTINGINAVTELGVETVKGYVKRNLVCIYKDMKIVVII